MYGLTITGMALLASTVTADYTRSPVSHVKGKVFDRFVQIWLENTDFDKAQGDPNLAWLATKGITLTNYFAVTHPSEPNYVASVAGEYWGMNNDDLTTLPSNVSTVVDLLEDRGISWGEYQEDMPFTGYQGNNYSNVLTGANDYVRKHNPLVNFETITSVPDRLACIKNLTLFAEDLKCNTLPQWMFITPNMTSDGHDTSVTTAGTWTRTFLEPLLKNKSFMKKTLVFVTFDESHTYTAQNRVFGILLGDAVPSHLEGTTDDHYYDHYSSLATVEANWNLNTLGRWDTQANVFDLVGKHTHDKIRVPQHGIDGQWLNASIPGYLNTAYGPTAAIYAPPMMPDLHARRNGRVVLNKIKKMWKGVRGYTTYTQEVEIPSLARPPVYRKIRG